MYSGYFTNETRDETQGILTAFSRKEGRPKGLFHRWLFADFAPVDYG